MARLYARVQKGTKKELKKIAKGLDKNMSKFLRNLIFKIIKYPKYYEFMVLTHKQLIKIERPYLKKLENRVADTINLNFPEDKIKDFEAIAKYHDMGKSKLLKDIVEILVDIPDLYNKIMYGIKYEKYKEILEEIEVIEESEKVKFAQKKD